MISLRHVEQAVLAFGSDDAGTTLRIGRKADRSLEVVFHAVHASLLPRIRVEHAARGILSWQWVMVGSCGLDEQGLASAMHQHLQAAECAWAAFLEKHAAIAMVCCKRNWRARADYQQGEL